MKKQILLSLLLVFTTLSIIAQNEDDLFVKRMEEIHDHGRSGNFEDATSLLFSTLEIIEQHDLEPTEKAAKKSAIYRELANIYILNNDSLAIHYNHLAMTEAHRSKDSRRVYDAHSKNYYLGLRIRGYMNTETLLATTDSCLKYALQANNKTNVCESYEFKFQTLYQMGQTELANAYLDSASALVPEVENRAFLTNFYLQVGLTYAFSGQFELAKINFEKSRDVAEELNLSAGYADAVYNLAFVNMDLGNYQEANQYFMVYIDSTEALKDRMIEKRFTEADARFNVAEKDKELAQKNEEIAQNELVLAEERQWTSYIIFGSVILLLLVLGVFQYFIFKQKRITNQKELELAKEQEFNELRTEFLENIAHEIRTPLTLINGYLSLAMDQVADDKKAVGHIQKAMNGSEKVLENAGEILELLKFEKGKLPIAKNKIVINDFLRRVFYSFDSLAQLKELDLKYFSDIESNIVIESDEGRIEKILNNLISNAIKFSPRKSSIEMVVETKNNILSLRLNDQGPGIPANEQEAIFKRFYQSRSTNSVGGVGVGLSLAKDFSLSLGGDLTVQSSPGEGSSFLWSMPMKIITDSVVAESSDKEEKRVSSKRINIENLPEILIVEDNAEMSAYLIEILSKEFQVDYAFDGAEAINMINEKKYKLIISDVMMPNVDGFELREHVRKLQNYTNVPFIFLTAKASLDDRLKGFSMGVDEYLAKPFSKEELLMRIQNILETKTEREKWVNDNLEFLGDKDQTAEEALMEKINSLIRERLSHEDFSIPDLASEVGYSQRQLARIIKKQTGMSPVQYVLEIRLQKAYSLLIEKRFNSLSEVRYKVGINSASHFNTKFKERFGVKPSEV